MNIVPQLQIVLYNIKHHQWWFTTQTWPPVSCFCLSIIWESIWVCQFWIDFGASVILVPIFLKTAEKWLSSDWTLVELNSFELYSIHQIDISKLQIYFRVGATLLRLRSTLSRAGSSSLRAEFHFIEGWIQFTEGRVPLYWGLVPVYWGLVSVYWGQSSTLGLVPVYWVPLYWGLVELIWPLPNSSIMHYMGAAPLCKVSVKNYKKKIIWRKLWEEYKKKKIIRKQVEDNYRKKTITRNNEKENHTKEIIGRQIMHQIGTLYP